MNTKPKTFGGSFETRTLEVFSPPHLLSEPFNRFFRGRNEKDLSRLCACFPKHWDIYLLGGLLRNLLLEELRRLKIAHGDVDIVIGGATSTEELHKALRQFYVRRNEFGGLKCRTSRDGILFDVWRIEDHATTIPAATPRSIEGLLRRNLLDIDAILWDLRSGYLYDYGCISAIQSGRIQLLGNEGISDDFAAAQVAHILIVAFKTRLELSEQTRRFVRQLSRTDGLRGEISRIFQRKLPSAAAELERLLNELIMEDPHIWPKTMTR